MNRIEFAFKIIDISIAFIGLILVIFGWIIPYKNSIKAEERRIYNDKKLEKIRWEKELIDRQISSLYGPIYALQIESGIRFSRILYQLGRQYAIPKDKTFEDLPENEQSIWKHFVDTYVINTQMKIVEIMRRNIHLVYKSEIPNCYYVYLDYALGWELLDNQKRNGVPNYYQYHYIINYPTEFQNYIKKTLHILLKRQDELLSESDCGCNTRYNLDKEE